MANAHTILVYEHDILVVGESYGDAVFTEQHFAALDQYYIHNPGCLYFTPLNRRIKFNQFVGMLRVGNVTIEVLPKSDRHEGSKEMWQSVLLQMLAVSRNVEAQATTHADIQIKRHSVLETYLHLFLDEVNKLVHAGLIKKYRTVTENQTALKGRLNIQKQLAKNYVHAERFYVTHPVYDRNNIFNAILEQTLRHIEEMHVSAEISKRCGVLLLNFPECDLFQVNEKLFNGLVFNRKTEGYRVALEIARIILFNYHPDIKGGHNHILAIMFDMNRLWESYMYEVLKQQEMLDPTLRVYAQHNRYFWQHPDNWSLRLKPDIVIEKGETTIVIDTKWKYKSDTSIQDVRQMYAYGHYLNANRCYLLYPDRLEGASIIKREGKFYDVVNQNKFQDKGCGLLFVDMLEGSKLKSDVGKSILNEIEKF